LADEQPQTLALVLSHLPAQLAAETLAAMSPERQTAIIGRIAAMDPPSEEVVRTVAEAVRRRVFGDAAPRTPHSAPSGVTNVVRMLNVMVPAAERRLLGDLAQAETLYRALHAERPGDIEVIDCLASLCKRRRKRVPHLVKREISDCKREE